MSEPEKLNESDATIPRFTWPIERIFKDRCEEVYDPVVLEEPLEILVNGHRVAILMRMPGQEKELAAGFCVSEGYIRRVRDILLIHHCGLGLPSPIELETEESPESRNRVEVTVVEGAFVPSGDPDVTRLIRSGCGAADVSAMSETLPTVHDGLTVDASLILGFGKALRGLQALHRDVGGTHSAALFTAAGDAVTQAEDIGRHNAVDKVAGYCLLRRIPLQDKILVTSGRASYEMATKAARLGIPIVATISAPTMLAVQIAEEHGLTMIGYLRGGRMNVYTHAERVRNAGSR